jgi:hypothetical protein
LAFINERIDFKILVLTFKALNGTAPRYLYDILTPYQPKRLLRSTNRGLLTVPNFNLKRYGRRAFSVAALILYSEIVCVNETWLNKNILNCEILGPDYEIFRKDRESIGGGVLMAIKSESFKHVRQIEINCNIEIVTVDVTTQSNLHLLICSCYRPPNSNDNWLKDFKYFLSVIRDQYDDVIIAGDFNLPDINWQNSGDDATKASTSEFSEILKDFFLSQLNTHTTRGNGEMRKS